MACGGGMYILAIVSTALVLIGLEAFNYFLHRFDSLHNRNVNANPNVNPNETTTNKYNNNEKN